jgi:hypothetical protein
MIDVNNQLLNRLALSMMGFIPKNGILVFKNEMSVS